MLTGDKHCVQALAVFIQHIVNNTLPAAVRELLTTSYVVSLKKPESDGRRPIAIGDMFVRLAARFALCQVSRAAQDAMRPSQFGAGQPDGATQIVQSVQHLLSTPCTTTLPLGRPLACLRIDIRNAFNAIDRAAVLKAVYDRPELACCWRTVAFGYGQPSKLLMQCDETVPDSEAYIESSMGVRQGDPLAAMLFSLAMHGVYSEASRMSSGGCYSYVDDSNIIGTVEECWRVWTRLPDLLKPLGLSVNLSKCDLTCFDLSAATEDVDQAALHAFQAANITINERWVRLLGCVIGLDDACIAEALQADSYFRADAVVALRRLPRMHRGSAMLLLRSLSGHVITNRLRAMPPAATLQHAAEYDRGVLRVAHSLIGITRAHGDRYDGQLQRSLRMGGFGLTSAVTLAPAAYIAGAEVAMRLSDAFATVWSGAEPVAPSCRQYLALDDCILRVTGMENVFWQQLAATDAASSGEVPAPVLPDSAHDFVRHFSTASPTVIQSAVVHRIQTLSFIASTKAAVDAGRSGLERLARMDALRQPGSADWLTVMPTEARLRLSDVHWRWAAQLRLGLQLPTLSDTCHGCNKTGLAPGDGWHLLSCSGATGRIKARHDEVVNILSRFARVIGAVSLTEPVDLDADSEKRPDLEIRLPKKTLLVDVQASSPWRVSGPIGCRPPIVSGTNIQSSGFFIVERAAATEPPSSV